MITKESQAQIEVWEWKEKASAEWLKIPEAERIAWLKERTSSTIAKLNIKKAILKPVIR